MGRAKVCLKRIYLGGVFVAMISVLPVKSGDGLTLSLAYMSDAIPAARLDTMQADRWKKMKKLTRSSSHFITDLLKNCLDAAGLTFIYTRIAVPFALLLLNADRFSPRLDSHQSSPTPPQAKYPIGGRNHRPSVDEACRHCVNKGPDGSHIQPFPEVQAALVHIDGD